MTPASRDELETRLARMSRELHYHQRQHHMYYDRLRKLENVIREAANVDALPTRQILTDLARRVPKQPRKTLTEIRKSKRR